MLTLLFKVSLTVSFMPREEYIVGTFALTNACPTQNDSEGRTQTNERLIVTHRFVLEHCGTVKDCVFPKTHVSLELLPPPLLPEALWSEAMRSSFSAPFLLFSLSFLLWTELLLTDCPIYSHCGGSRCHQKNELGFYDEYAAPPLMYFLTLPFYFSFSDV